MQDNVDWRNRLRHHRQHLSARYQHEAAQAIISYFCLLPELKHWKNIGVYWADEGEVNLEGVIQYCWQQEKNCYLPCLAPAPKKTLRFALYTADMPMQLNRYSIPEPITTSTVAATTLDVILMPLVAFDMQGNRLGRGGGFYDKTLFPRQAVPFLIGAGYDFQQLPHLFTKPGDVALDAILTPTRYIRCAKVVV